MSDSTFEIRQQIERLRKLADDQKLCGVDIGRTGQCHASWEMEEAADTLEKLLVVYECVTRPGATLRNYCELGAGPLYDAIYAIQSAEREQGSDDE